MALTILKDTSYQVNMLFDGVKMSSGTFQSIPAQPIVSFPWFIITDRIFSWQASFR